MQLELGNDKQGYSRKNVNSYHWKLRADFIVKGKQLIADDKYKIQSYFNNIYKFGIKIPLKKVS